MRRTQDKIRQLKKDYFPGLDAAQISLRLFNRDDKPIIWSVEKMLAELGLRKRKLGKDGN